MKKLKLINQDVYDLGVKKYYEGVYDGYLDNGKDLFQVEYVKDVG
jgi:hypothetical protein